MKRIKNEYYNCVIEYLSLTEKVSYTKICSKYHLDRHILAKYAKEWKGKVEEFKVYYGDLEKDGFNYHFEDNEKQCVEEFVNAGMISTAKLAHKYNFSDDKVKNLVSLITKEEYKPKNKKIFKRDIFHIIDTQEKAYWLGFLTADGYNNEDRGELKITLGNVDKNHLEKFCKFLEVKDSIDTYVRPSIGGVGQRTWTIQIGDRGMSNDLKNLGVFQRKSTKEEFNWNLDEKLLPHYIRGYFDGDGHISKKRPVVNIVSSKSFCESLKKYSEEKIGIYFNPRYKYVCCKEKELYSFTLSNEISSMQFLDHIYKDATIYLDRKYDIYLSKKKDC